MPPHGALVTQETAHLFWEIFAHFCFLKPEPIGLLCLTENNSLVQNRTSLHIGLDSIGRDWIGLDGIVLDWIELDLIGFVSIELYRIGLEGIGLDWSWFDGS